MTIRYKTKAVFFDVSKEKLATAIRSHQVAVDATKSPQREAAVDVNCPHDIIHHVEIKKRVEEERY
jgi:hypothetical protein